MFTQIMYEPN